MFRRNVQLASVSAEVGDPSGFEEVVVGKNWNIYDNRTVIILERVDLISKTRVNKGARGAKVHCDSIPDGKRKMFPMCTWQQRLPLLCRQHLIHGLAT